MTVTIRDRLIVAAIIAIAVIALLAMPARAQCDATCSQVPEPPILAPGPCTSTAPWTCYAWHLFMPEVAR